MLRTTTICLLSLSTLAPVTAQRGEPARGERRGGGSVPAVGSMLPDVTAIDEQGKPFSTSTLRGSYTVLVFGCLT